MKSGMVIREVSLGGVAAGGVTVNMIGGIVVMEN